MRLQRFGVLLILVGVGAIVLLQFRREIPISHGSHNLRVAAVVGLGLGVVVTLLGAVTRRPPAITRKPRYLTDWQAAPRRGRPAGFVQSVAPANPPATAMPSACSNCRSALVAGAKYCPRCGAAVASVFQPAPRTPAPRMVNRRPGRKFGMLGILAFLAAVAGGSYVFAYWQHYGRAPWANWKWDCYSYRYSYGYSCPSSSGAAPQASPPALPDPQATVPPSTTQAATITRVQLQPLRWASGFVAQPRTFNVSYAVTHPQAGTMVAVVVRFKDEHGRTLPGRNNYVGQSGELEMEFVHVIAAGTGPFTVTDEAVTIPASVVPPRAWAEFTVCNSVWQTISDPVSFKMP